MTWSRIAALPLLAFGLALAGCAKEDEGGPGKGPPPAMPSEFLTLASGFAAEKVTNAAKPVKLAFAPDGRLFFTELDSGQIRIIENGTLLAAPFATVGNLVTGNECGLLGICFSPTFSSDGYVYVMATISNGTPPHKQQIIRFTASGNTGSSPTVIVDNLPQHTVHNAGNIGFGPDSKLYCSVGDAGDVNLPQTDGSLAGRILRYEANGTAATGNPTPGNPEYCRGLRNTFDFCFHPVSGGLFGSENGPTDNDEINYLAAGKNFEWQTLPMGVPQSAIGYRVRVYVSVIAPTGICWHTGQQFGSEFNNNLFLCSYDYAEIRRLRMSGSAFADVDSEEVFASLNNTGVDNKPLDIVMGPDGALYVSTFTAIWRIWRW